MMELDETRESALAECLTALDAGADIEACLARYPEHAQALRLYLELRTELLTLGQRPEPPTQAYQAGRLTLLQQVAAPPSQTAGRALVHAFGLRWKLFGEQVRSFAAGRWNGLASPLARVAAAGAVLLLVGGGALGASAAGGFEPARQVLSALHLVDSPSEEGEALSPQDTGEALSPEDAGEAAPVDTDSALGDEPAPNDGGVLVPPSEEEPVDREEPRQQDEPPALVEPVPTDEPTDREKRGDEEPPVLTEPPAPTPELKEEPTDREKRGDEEEPAPDEKPNLTN